MRCKKTGEEVAIKFIERGDKVRGRSLRKELLNIHVINYVVPTD